MKEFNIGDIVEGRVTGIEDYGIFVSFGENCSGLIHISEISNSFVRNVSDYASINEKIQVRIISRDEKGHYKLSLKQINGEKEKNDMRIKETQHGFETLQKSLNNWIKETISEIEKK